MDHDDKVRLGDLRAAGICWRRGAKLFLIHHEINPDEFLKSGIDADILLATGNAIAKRAVEVSRGRKK